MKPQQLGELRRPTLRRLTTLRADGHVVERLRRADLVDRLEMAGEMLAVAEVEQHGVTVGSEEEITAGIVQAVDLHVAGVAGITAVDRAEEDDAGEIGPWPVLAH